MKAVVISLIVVFFLGLSYSIYSKKEMHTKLENYIINNQSIRDVIGVYEDSYIINSGSDCKYGGDCELTFLTLMIKGSLGCIRSRITLHEFFPKYRVISISPKNYFEREPLEKIVHGFEGMQARSCKSA